MAITRRFFVSTALSGFLALATAKWKGKEARATAKRGKPSQLSINYVMLCTGIKFDPTTRVASVGYRCAEFDPRTGKMTHIGEEWFSHVEI